MKQAMPNMINITHAVVIIITELNRLIVGKEFCCLLDLNISSIKADEYELVVNLNVSILFNLLTNSSGIFIDMFL